jgi:hypothetical protein
LNASARQRRNQPGKGQANTHRGPTGFYDTPGHEMIHQLKNILKVNFLPDSETAVTYDEIKSWLEV